MSAKLYIAVPAFNRRKVLELCLPTLFDAKGTDDILAIYDDGSTEWGMHYAMFESADRVDRAARNVGIDAQRRRHFMDFMETDCSHLYLTDSDAIHDPRFRMAALDIQNDSAGAPLCLYNTNAHANLEGNTLEDDPASPIIWRYYAPGISYLLTRQHAERVVEALPSLPVDWYFDWTVPTILGNRFAVTRHSFVDHIGWKGMHHDERDGVEGGDRALNPSSWLIETRAEIVRKLSSSKD